jgi:hypothetical protein
LKNHRRYHQIQREIHSSFSTFSDINTERERERERERDSVSINMATLEKQVMVVGIDDSEHSTYALEWTLDHFFTPSLGSNSLFKLVVVYAKPSASSAVGFAGPGISLFIYFPLSFFKNNIQYFLSGFERIKLFFFFVFRGC